MGNNLVPNGLQGSLLQIEVSEIVVHDLPVTEAEVDVFEAWFGDLFDELFSTGD